MNGLTLMAVVIVCLWLGYHFYGRWLEKTWGIDPNAKTPAALRNDGKDYQPASRLSVFAHQFTSITGAGPVTGPIIAAMFGWLPALLWIIIGGIFFGAVQDFTALYASVRNGGKSMGMIIEQYVGRFGRQLFLAFCWLFTLLVIAAFADMIAATFNGFTKTGEQNMPNAAAASISMIYIVGAVIFGLFQKYVKPSSGLMIAMLAMGIAWPIYADADTWRVVVFLYAFAASVMPMWILKQPRDFLSMFLLFGMIIAGVVGVFVTNPTINMPAFVGWEVKGLDLFPILFVTIACGAISGFHSLVSSGTSSKMIANETDAMTTVDAVARIGRMSFQELFATTDGREKGPIAKFLSNTWVSTLLTLGGGWFLCLAGYMNIWPLFGSANQLLGALVLTALAVFLQSTGRKGWMLWVPMTVMFVVTMTALVQALLKIAAAWSAGTFVFMTHGLQAIIAIALIVLALLVVYHCVGRLFKGGKQDATGAANAA